MERRVIRAELKRERAELARRLDALRKRRGPRPGMGPTVVSDSPMPWLHAAEHEIRRGEIRLAEIDYRLAATRNAK